MRSLICGQAAACHSVRDTILLIFAALTDLIVTEMGSAGVVFVIVDLIAQPVLLAIYLLLFALGEFTAIRSTVVANLTVEVRFFAFEVFVSPVVNWPDLMPPAIRSC